MSYLSFEGQVGRVTVLIWYGSISYMSAYFPVAELMFLMFVSLASMWRTWVDYSLFLCLRVHTSGP